MPVPRRRHSPCRQAKSRTHKKLRAQIITTCPKCGEPRLPHRVCQFCGEYKGVSYKTVVTK